MARPPLETATRRLLRDESITIMALFGVKTTDEGPFYCAMCSPGEVLDPGNCYAYAEGPSPDDAVHEARLKLWNGL